mmetsp:Transcript_7104/g.10506  ORF Transcript_7104/g.10506 Transcript_7104/m.10506 type:complete len:201 (+) Transcript_7104:621-1223(+)
MYWIRSANTSAPNVRRSAAAHISMFLSTITSISLSAPPPSAVFATFASECQCWIPRRKRVRHGITAAEGVEAGNSESMFSSSGSRLHHAFHKNIRQISTAAWKRKGIAGEQRSEEQMSTMVLSTSAALDDHDTTSVSLRYSTMIGLGHGLCINGGSSCSTTSPRLTLLLQKRSRGALCRLVHASSSNFAALASLPLLLSA